MDHKNEHACPLRSNAVSGHNKNEHLALKGKEKSKHSMHAHRAVMQPLDITRVNMDAHRASSFAAAAAMTACLAVSSAARARSSARSLAFSAAASAA